MMKLLFWIFAIIGAIVTLGWLLHWFARIAWGLLAFFGPILLVIGIIGLIFSTINRVADR
jgi:hypothetical protein